MNASFNCGLNLSDWERLELGQIVGIILTKYKTLSESGEVKKKTYTRPATQKDFDNF